MAEGDLVLAFEVNGRAVGIKHADGGQYWVGLRLGPAGVRPDLGRLRSAADAVSECRGCRCGRGLAIDVGQDGFGMAGAAGALQDARVAGFARPVVAVDAGDARRGEGQDLPSRQIIDGRHVFHLRQGYGRACAGLAGRWPASSGFA